MPGASALTGPQCLYRGFSALFDRRWRGLVLTPLLINVLLFAAGTVAAVHYVGDAVQWLRGLLPGWLD